MRLKDSLSEFVLANPPNMHMYNHQKTWVTPVCPHVGQPLQPFEIIILLII